MVTQSSQLLIVSDSDCLIAQAQILESDTPMIKSGSSTYSWTMEKLSNSVPLCFCLCKWDNNTSQSTRESLIRLCMKNSWNSPWHIVSVAKVHAKRKLFFFSYLKKEMWQAKFQWLKGPSQNNLFLIPHPLDDLENIKENGIIIWDIEILIKNVILNVLFI